VPRLIEQVEEALGMDLA